MPTDKTNPDSPALSDSLDTQKPADRQSSPPGIANQTTVPAEAHDILESMLEEAIDTTLPSGEDITPISPLPQAHYPSTMSSTLRPRILSQITRSTMPTASLTYAEPLSMSTEYPHAESSAAARRRAMSFPDLDPMTGLPLDSDSERGVNGNGMRQSANGLQLQRTITGLLKSPTQTIVPGMGLPSMGLPKMQMPALPSLPGWQGGQRSMSTSSANSAQGDWGWGWWNGNKSKVDRMMSDEDQAETVEEEQEKHKRKCTSKPPRRSDGPLEVLRLSELDAHTQAG